jgi:5'-phosphate synthase pdxT subunit
MTVVRNAFGRQRESFEANLPIAGFDRSVHAVFIRAPLIREVGPGVQVLCTFKDDIVAARDGHVLAASFHPELTDDYGLHAYFLEMVKEQALLRQSK